MARDKSKKSLQTEEQVARFKWEFLRRNEDYQKDYAAFEGRFGSWFHEHGYWWSHKGPTYDTQAWFFFCSQIAPAAKEICARWGVSEPFDPSWVFDEGGCWEVQGTFVPMPYFTSSGDNSEWDFEVIDPALFPTEEERIAELLRGVPDFVDPKEHWKDAGDRRFIRVEIDITKPLETSIAQVERRIDFARRLFEAQVGPIPDHRRKPRVRLDQYESYLKVWQLRKEGKTFEQIAREVFPREMENPYGFSPGIKKARSHYKRACELVAGGYRQIEA